MIKKTVNKNEVIELITAGKKLILAADEKILNDLPKGQWIAGTIPYFMDEDGGKFTQEEVFVTELPDYVASIDVQVYSKETLSSVYSDAPGNGFTFIIIPATSPTHISFAIDGPNYPEFATKPLIGWISGVFLDELGQTAPKVLNGNTGESYTDSAVVMHIALPSNKLPQVNIVNLFDSGDGDTITFNEEGFSVKEAFVNGEPVNFAEYILGNNIDTRLPLVADMYGARINTSFQNVNEAEKVVNLYAPVFREVEYKIAEPVSDYVTEFNQLIPKDIGDTVFFSCNCILNYLYAELEGKKTADITGPMTFGEIAYQLLNQTMAYIIIEDC
ncbi:DUF6976 family protein [Desulfobacter curvatus]|uniref:DUF6976 family protein n=1 Tax=Desulfobacter curvatus TaxID=2290 RepID=UPI0003628CEF|nr:hypothetical protein [Desulfobacter curvatus]